MVLLARLGKKASGGLPHFLEESRIYSMPLAPLYSLLAFLPFAALPVCFFFPGAGFCIMFLSICLNFYLYYRVKREIQGDLDRLRDAFFPFMVQRKTSFRSDLFSFAGTGSFLFACLSLSAGKALR